MSHSHSKGSPIASTSPDKLETSSDSHPDQSQSDGFEGIEEGTWGLTLPDAAGTGSPPP